MLERLTGALLVALNEPAADAETQVARWALVSGRRCVARGECPAARLARLGGLEVRASFFDRAAHFDRIVSQTTNPRLAQVFVRRHIDGQMLFNESYRLRTKLIPLGEADVVVRALAAAELACARASDALPLATRPVGLMTLEEAAMAALAARATAEPLLVCHARGDRFVAFLAEAGELRMRRVEYATAGDLGALTEAVERSTAQFSSGGVPEPAARLLLGDLRPLAKEERYQRDHASREVERKIAALVTGADALAEPELFGLRYVRAHWNLLEPAQARSALAWKAALPAAGLLLAGAAFAGVLGGFSAAENASLAARLAAQRADVERERAALAQRVPDEADSRRLAEFANLMQQRGEQVRVDRLLSWLTHELPAGAVVESLAVYPQDEAPPESVRAAEGGGDDLLARIFGRQRTPATAAPKPAVPAKAGPGQYRARIELSFPGSYEAVERAAGETVKRLADRLAFEMAVLDYDAPRGRARFIAEARLAAREF